MTDVTIEAMGGEGPFARARARFTAAAAGYAARNTDIDAGGRTYARLLALMLTLAAVRAVYVVSTGVDAGEESPLRSWAIGIGMLLVAVAAGRHRLAEAALALRAGALLALTRPLFASFCIVVFATGRRYPLLDGAFEAADRALGLDWLTYARLLDAHEWLWRITTLAYASIGPQFAVVIMVMVFARQAKRLYAYLLAQTLALSATALVAMLLPAIGAYAQAGGAQAGFIHAFGTADSMTASIEWLRLGGIGASHIDNTTLISFPSFHACCCVLFAWSTWRIPVLRWAMLVLNGAMMAATPVHGSHYFVDVIAGAAIAALAIVASKAAVRRLSTAPPARHAAADGRADAREMEA